MTSRAFLDLPCKSSLLKLLVCTFWAGTSSQVITRKRNISLNLPETSHYCLSWVLMRAGLEGGFYCKLKAGVPFFLCVGQIFKNNM